MNFSPIFFHDFYKAAHKDMYPANTMQVYSNFTARTSRIEGIDEILIFGVQYLVKKYLVQEFQDNFFEKTKTEVIGRYQYIMDFALGAKAINTKHLEDLHDLRYLPIIVKALPEGTLCPIKVPFLTITNTHVDFAWLPNFLETLISNVLWHPITAATMAYQFRKVLHKYAERTSDDAVMVPWQGHDFSMRGQTSIESSMVCGAAHLTCFTGTDTVPSILMLAEYYGASYFVGGSVPATEHSVMCMGGKDNEYETYRRLIEDIYPKGIVSIVSDTWDYWKVINEYLPKQKDKIMAREGKVVIRPDSGDPLSIITETLWRLWDIFGGTVNSKGFKVLDPHIGLIYGDSITLELCKKICVSLEAMGYASTNVVFGIGSYTYQHVTRDTFGFAMKATYGVVDGKPMNIFKDPVTDDGVKKSAKGLLRVDRVDGKLALKQEVSIIEEHGGELLAVFANGTELNTTSLKQIRQRINEGL